MAITSTTAEYLSDSVVRVTVVSDLIGDVLYHWYRDGAYVGMTTQPSQTFHVEPGEQVEIEAIDTLDVGFDPIASAPVAHPARRTIHWLRSLAADVAAYRVEKKGDLDLDWVPIGNVRHDATVWAYSLLSGRLDDLDKGMSFQVIPIDSSGNDGPPIAIAAERIVRTPDAPNFSATYDGGSQKVTFAEVA